MSANRSQSLVEHLVANERRARILKILADVERPLSLGALAERVASAEVGAERPSADRIESVEVTLHHIHVPRLEDAGVVDVDGDRVALATDPDAVDRVSEALTELIGEPVA